MTKDHAYLYLSSFAEAKRQNEVALWRASHLENIACKQAIEESIRRGFDGMHLDRDCARSVIDNFGFKRVGWVLSATLQQKQYDGRFSPQNKAWAASTFIPPSDRNYEFTVESHPAVLDGFVNDFRKAQAELKLFTGSQCDDTVTLLVTTEQAKVLAGLEQESELHLALVYRGAPENADEFIAAQDALIEELYAEPEAEAAEGAENAESAETEESEGADPAAESEAAGE